MHSLAAEMTGDLLAEMNLARTQPQTYAQIVAERGPSLGHNPRVVQEAVHFLQQQGAVPAFVRSSGLTHSALSHVLDTGSRGTRGHRGSDGSNVSSRASRFGRWDVRIGENICYGRNNARDAIVCLIIDDGVGDRAHRRNIFEKSFRFAGAAGGPHANMRAIVVTDFAAVYYEAGGSRTADAAEGKRGSRSADERL
jgi:uncharacterized protein YkwD